MTVISLFNFVRPETILIEKGVVVVVVFYYHFFGVSQHLESWLWILS